MRVAEKPELPAEPVRFGFPDGTGTDFAVDLR
jgi:hypothetical protein